MFPKLARYGSDVIAVVLIACVLMVFISFVVPVFSLKITLDAVSFLVAGFTLYFFRDPERTPVASGEEFVISPADGKIVFVGDVDEPEFMKSRSKMVSIFMSPVNVHVNRIPVSGVVKFLRYVKGEYIVAFDEKSSERNERMLIGIENKGQRVLFKQIAGFIARRIVCELVEGQEVRVAERFGMIKFGSRVDVHLPMNCEVRVKPGEKATAGRSVLGVLRNE